VEEGATNEDLDLDNDDDYKDAMDIASDEDDAIVYVTAGGILPPHPSSHRGRDEAPVARRRPPPSSPHREKKLQRRGERAMDEGYVDDEGVVGGGREGAGRAAEPLRWRRLPSRVRSWWPTSGRSRTSDALLQSSSRPPHCCRGRGGMVGYSYSLSSTCPRTTISRGNFGDECKFIYS